MNAAQSPFQLYQMPDLRAPYLVAAWTGMGAVGLLSANYLRQEIDAQLCGRIDPQAFFTPAQITIEEGIIRPPVLPETKLYCWDRGARHDLLILIGTEQPADGYRMAQVVTETAQRLGVHRIYTTAAMPTMIHHNQEPRVWGTATHPDLLLELGHHNVALMEQGSIGGLNGLLLAVAREVGIDGTCLLGEIPLYATQMVNPAGARAVLDVLTGMLGIELGLEKLYAWAQDLSGQMDQLYNLLPDDVKERLDQEQPPAPRSPRAGPEADQPLVADDAFFQEIERFLDRQGRDESDADQDAGDTGPGDRGLGGLGLGPS